MKERGAKQRSYADRDEARWGGEGLRQDAVPSRYTSLRTWIPSPPATEVHSFIQETVIFFVFLLSPSLSFSRSLLHSIVLSALFIFLLFPPVAACQYTARSCIPPVVECSIRRNGSGVLVAARIDVKRRGGRRVGLKDRIAEARQAIAISRELWSMTPISSRARRVGIAETRMKLNR